MNSESPLRQLLYNKGWRLVHLEEELAKRGTPVSWPTLIKIKDGCRLVPVRKNGKIVAHRRMAYKPSKRILADIAKVLKTKPENVFTDTSNERANTD